MQLQLGACYTWTCAVAGYAQKGILKEARSMFDAMRVKNAISWPLMAAYVQQRMIEEAKELFCAMPCSTWLRGRQGVLRLGCWRTEFISIKQNELHCTVMAPKYLNLE